VFGCKRRWGRPGNWVVGRAGGLFDEDALVGLWMLPHCGDNPEDWDVFPGAASTTIEPSPGAEVCPEAHVVAVQHDGAGERFGVFVDDHRDLVRRVDPGRPKRRVDLDFRRSPAYNWLVGIGKRDVEGEEAPAGRRRRLSVVTAAV